MVAARNFGAAKRAGETLTLQAALEQTQNMVNDPDRSPVSLQPVGSEDYDR